MKISKISFDSINFEKCDGDLNLKDRKIHFELNADIYEKMTGHFLGLVIADPDMVLKDTKNIYIISDDNVQYSCLNCISKFNLPGGRKKVLFDTLSIDSILENYISDKRNIMIDEYIIKTFYIDHPIHNTYIENVEFRYSNNILISIKKILLDNVLIDIRVKSKNKMKLESLSEYAYKIYEMFFLFLGDLPIIDKCLAVIDEKTIVDNVELANKYSVKRERKFGFEILGNISKNTFNKNNYRKFIKFRKNTGILYDMLLDTVNSDKYLEIKCKDMIELMEGFSKTLNINFDSLPTLLEKYYTNKNIYKILSRRDKRTITVENGNMYIFTYKASNHRNYLSHLNINDKKNTFVKLENIYAYWKFRYIIRIFILEFLTFPYDNKKIIKYRKYVDKWAKKNKIRFSHRINKEICKKTC